jgi:hypothetical protein
MGLELPLPISFVHVVPGLPCVTDSIDNQESPNVILRQPCRYPFRPFRRFSTLRGLGGFGSFCDR